MDKSTFGELLKEYPEGFVLEQYIKQTAELAKFHPNSVNTVRATTILYDDRTEIIHPFIRFGQKGSVVDNGGAGGIICTADVNTGVITNAIDEFGKRYVIHPDSNLKMIGYQIPRWEEMKTLAIELASVIPTNRFTGWDLALTDDGWIMVEGNAYGQFFGRLRSKRDFDQKLKKH